MTFGAVPVVCECDSHESPSYPVVSFAPSAGESSSTMASRSRRAVSPLPSSNPPRFPPRAPISYSDADEKRATAVSGSLQKSYPSGGLKVSASEWWLLAAVVVLALGVRLFRLSQPNSVVYVSLPRYFECRLTETMIVDLMRFTLENSLPSISKLSIMSMSTLPSRNF